MSYVKGNWEVNGFEIQTKGKETFIAEVYQENKDAKANAKLIAAAPDLLEACKKIEDATLAIDNGAPLSLLKPAISDCITAIAKAERDS